MQVSCGFTRRAGDREPHPDVVSTDDCNGLEGKGWWAEPDGRQEAARCWEAAGLRELGSISITATSQARLFAPESMHICMRHKEPGR